MAQHHKWSPRDIEEMIPFERDMYWDMLVATIEEQKVELENRK